MQIPKAEDQNVAWHFFWIVLPVVLSVLAGQFFSYQASKRRGEKKDKARMEQQDLKDDRLAMLLEQYRLHDHSEWKHDSSTGPLHAENIRYPRRIAETHEH